ncbi:MAG: Fe(3+) ABC transporter substrate-binding protein [Pseudomonadota bacterium]
MHRTALFVLLATAAPVALTSVAHAAGELNLYSSRHYDTDEALYAEFEEQTGITINRIEGNADELISRIETEGANSPADVLLTVDAGRLWRAEQAGLFQPVESEVLASRIPDEFRHPDGLWFGFSERARVIYYDKERIDPALLQTYEALADEALRGEVCIRPGSNIYNLSLMASLIDHVGAEAAEQWAEGVVANFAREPQGNDTAQIRAVAAGECGVSVGNTYYMARLMRSDDPADKEVVEAVGVVFPNQEDRGTHVNISGAGVLTNAPNRDAAVQFLEYLASDQAQAYFANGNNEYAVVDTVEVDNPALDTLGAFVADDLNVAVLGANQTEAQQVYDRAGWK